MISLDTWDKIKKSKDNFADVMKSVATEDDIHFTYDSGEKQYKIASSIILSLSDELDTANLTIKMLEGELMHVKAKYELLEGSTLKDNR